VCETCGALALKLAAIAFTRPSRPTPFEELAYEFEQRASEITATLRNTGDIDLWHRQFDELLRDFHTKAYALGMDHGGASATSGLARLKGWQVADLESQYLQDFTAALRIGDPRYLDPTGKLKTDPVLQRMRLYSQKGRGTANYGFVDSGGPEEVYDWQLGGAEDHCEDCPVLAEGGPYTPATLYTTPGACDTPCLGNCKCRIERLSDGRTGILPLNYENEDAA